MGVLRSAAHRRAESRFWGNVFIIALHRAFVLGLGARHRGIVELSTSEGTVVRCVAVFACLSCLTYLKYLHKYRLSTFDTIHQGGPTSSSADASVPRLAGFSLIT